MADLRELYQEVILDHSRKPRNFRKIEDANRRAVGNNPLCGDRVTVYVRLVDGKLADVSFEGDGCAISKSSASMMTDAVKGKSEEQVESLFEKFHKMVTGESVDESTLGKLAVFAGVSQFPVRVKCASLGWHTLHAALEGSEETVSLE